MHVIRETEHGSLFTVGYYNPDGHWIAYQDCVSFDDAASLVSWLNGGLNPRLTDRLIEAFKIGGSFR